MDENVIIEIDVLECPICFLETDNVTSLPCCNYIMCVDCLNEWRKRSARCPNCQTGQTVSARHEEHLDDTNHANHAANMRPMCILCPLLVILSGWILYIQIRN